MNFDREFQMRSSDKTCYVCDYHMYLTKILVKPLISWGLEPVPELKTLMRSTKTRCFRNFSKKSIRQVH